MRKKQNFQENIKALNAMAAANARSLIAEAEDSFTTGNFSDAFDQYSRAFSINPQLKTRYERQFRVVFTQLVDYLEQKEENDALFQVYKQALSIFHGHVDILNDIGRFLLQKGFYLEAWNQFQKALIQKPESVIAEFQINVLKASLLHRWHYRMLNDKKRNSLYQIAIHDSVEPCKDRVMDLGTGTGLLAMYAAQCNPLSTVGIEMNNTLCEIAEHVVKENNFHHIKIINQTSYNISDTDIEGKQNLLITELFDAGLFGEGVLPSLHHAWLNLLHINGRVLPKRAEYFVRGVQCSSLMTRYYLNDNARSILNIPVAHVITSNDFYDCSDVHQYKKLKYMTEPKSVVQVNFNDVKDLETKLSEIKKYSVELNPVMDGVVDTVIGWFNLHLTDKISLTTDPTSEYYCNAWQQAIFSNFIPKQVKENYPFTVNFQLFKGKRLDLLPDTHCHAKISENTMRFLNDKLYMDVIISCVDTAFAYLQHVADISTVAIADLSPFPLFGLMMLKKGIQILYCQGKTIEDHDFFEKVFEANNINKQKYKIIDCEESIGNKRFHAIFFNIFDVCGDIDRVQMKKTHTLKVDNLIEGGLFMPYCISVMGQLINSPYLDVCNRVYDENTSFNMAHHVNKFQLSANYGIDYTLLDFTALADPVGLGVCGGMKSGIIDCTVLKDGCANALLCWYDIELLQNCGCITTRRQNSFIDAIAFLANPEVPLVSGDVADIICCVDEDQSFRFIIDIDKD